MSATQPGEYTVPPEMEETVSRLIWVLTHQLPKFVNRGTDLSSLPAWARMMLKGFLADSLKMAVTMVTAMVKHPSENRVLDREEFRIIAQELCDAFYWAFDDLDILSPVHGDMTADGAWKTNPQLYTRLRAMAGADHADKTQ